MSKTSCGGSFVRPIEYVCMYVCMLLPQAEGQGAGWPPVRRPLGPVWQPGEREKGAPSIIGSSRAGDHELTWLGRDSMSFADVGENAEAGGVQLHRRRRQLQGGSGPSDRSARHRTKNAGSRKCLHGGTISTLSCLMYVQYKSVYMLTVDHMMTPR